MDIATSGMKETRKMRKQRWGRLALPIGFAKRKYPRDSNYLMTNKNTMDRKNLILGKFPMVGAN
jgi:hypothetical protein